MPLPIFAVSPSALARFVVAAIVIGMLPVLFDNSYYISVFQGIAITYIVVLGLNLLMGFAGQASFGHAGFVAIGAYTAVLLTKQLGQSFWVGLFVAPLLAAAVGALLAIPALRTKGPFLVMITTAFGLAVHAVASTWIPVTGGPMGISAIPRPSIGDFRFDARAFFYLVAFTALVAHALVSNLIGGRWGRTLVAIRDAPLAAATLGISVNAWKTGAFALSAYLAGLAGVFTGFRNPFINSDSFTVAESLGYLLAAVFGGLGTVFGPLIGTLVLAAIPQVFAPLYDYQQFILGGLLIFTMLAMPQGVVGTIEGIAPIRRWSRAGIRPPAATPWQPPSPKPISSAVLETRSIERTFGGLRAVDNVDLAVEPAQIHGLIGPNGSGKSTLVNLISGVYMPSAGDAYLLGRPIGRLKPHAVARAGAVRTFQTPQLFGDLSVLENVLVGLDGSLRRGFVPHVLRTSAAVAEESAAAATALGLLTYVGLVDRALEPAASLPYGLQKLLEIARALAVRPVLLVLDEPAGGTNAAEIDRIVRVLRTLRDAGMSVLVIEHHMDVIEALCDRVAVLDFGKQIASGTPSDVLHDPRVIEAYLGSPTGTPA